MGVLYLLLAVLSSLGVALVLRWSEGSGNNRLAVISANYVSATLLAIAFGSFRSVVLPIKVLALGIGLGGLFLVGFLVLGMALRQQGVAASVTMSRVSLIVPVGAAMVFFRESPGVRELAAIVLILIVIWSWEGTLRPPAPILLLLFILFGLMSVWLKFFTFYFPNVPENSFLAVVFCSALVAGWGVRLLCRVPLRVRELRDGLILGVPNFFSSVFLVLSLEKLPTYVVFPVIDTGVIVFSALAGRLLFGERLGRRRKVCLVMAVVALLILGFSRQ